MLISVFAFSVNISAKKINVKYNKKKLEAGKLQVFTYKYKVKGGGEGKRLIGVILINAPMKEVWKTMEDWRSMPKFIKSISYCKYVHTLKPITDTSVGERLIETQLKVAFIKLVYTLHVKFDRKNYSQSWKMVKKDKRKKYLAKNIKLKKNSSSIKDIKGFEYLVPYDNGKKTIFYYAPIVETNVPVPGFIERSISKSSLNDFMLGLKKKIEGKG